MTCFHESKLTGLLWFQAKGSDRPSVGASLIKNSDKSGLSNDDLAWLLGAL